MHSRRDILQLLAAAPATLTLTVSTHAQEPELPTPTSRAWPPSGRWRPAYRTNAGSFAYNGYLGAHNDYVTDMLLCCDLGKIKTALIVCGRQVYINFRRAVMTIAFTPQLVREMGVEQLLDMHAIRTLKVMGAEVVADPGVPDGVMLFYDRADVAPELLPIGLYRTGPYPVGLLGFITGWTA